MQENNKLVHDFHFKLEAEIGAEDDENDSVYMDMENCNEAGTENVAASSSGVKQSTVASPSIDVVSLQNHVLCVYYYQKKMLKRMLSSGESVQGRCSH